MTKLSIFHTRSVQLISTPECYCGSIGEATITDYSGSLLDCVAEYFNSKLINVHIFNNMELLDRNNFVIWINMENDNTSVNHILV